MAVNTAALKTFAPAMRRQLMEAVGRKLDLLLNSQTPDTLSTYAKQIAELREEQEKSREQLLERVAYTWFNRLCALRYLDAKGWHPFGCKVLMPADGSETQPELLKLMRSGSLPSDLKTFTNEQRLNQLLDGQIPTAIPGGDAQGEVYRELVLAACRSYHNLLPDLFEGLDDASELLLPDDLLTEGSIAGSFRSSISDSDCDDVEIIGWLYQFYISEKKDEVIGKVVKSEDIPAATQLFTPNWIVKYMVQNTIGAQWLATYPNSPLREQMEYYIQPAEQTDEVNAKLAEITPKTLNPEELTLMDPACGSGHILVEAYEIFKAIYLEQGYQPREIPKLILEKNLFGLDIDNRATQLTIFCLLMKGREDSRRLFEQSIGLNVIALDSNSHTDTRSLARLINIDQHDVREHDLAAIDKFFEHSKDFGSLLKAPAELTQKLGALRDFCSKAERDMFGSESINKLESLVESLEFLTNKYDAVVANPPYMSSKSMNSSLKDFAKKYYSDARNDLFACFIERALSLTKKMGRSSLVTMQSWLFLTGYQKFREHMIRKKSIESLIQIGYNSFPMLNSKVAQAAAFSCLNCEIKDFTSAFVDLNSAPQSADKNRVFLDRKPSNQFYAKSIEFLEIPGSPLAYWVSKRIRNIFSYSVPLENIANPRQGCATSDNGRFLRYWHEVDYRNIGQHMTSRNQAHQSEKRWFPYNKGGAFRRWAGNYCHVVNWHNDGAEIKEEVARKYPYLNGNIDYVVKNRDCYFLPSASWSKVTSSGFALRMYEPGFIFDVSGCSIFASEIKTLYLLMGAMNSKVMSDALDSLSPTLNYEVGQAAAFPIAYSLLEQSEYVPAVKQLINIHKSDWDTSECSWGFEDLFIVSAKESENTSIKASYHHSLTRNRQTIEDARILEEENNKLFIDAYGLTEELTPDVPIEQITLTVNPAFRYRGDGSEEEKWERFQRDTMAELLSYATGCMMGRYSLDHSGLILADSRSNQDEQIAAFEHKVGKPIREVQFKPDADAIIPVLDGEWFEDDIVARTREFLKVTFPESSVAENLRFIEDSIGKDIRKYFCKDFYKDHLQTYKKRPIYWMVQSPKAGFACLIYLHRYTPDTLLQVLNNYFRPYLQKLEARQEQLERDQNNDALPKREQTTARKEAEKITKVLKECQAWEQDSLLPLAQQRIGLDLDDGVKVNYLKLQEVLAKIPGLAAKGD